MLEILINLIIGGVLAWCIYQVINWIPLQAPFKQIILVVFALMVFLWLLGVLGIYDSPARFRLNANQ